MSKKFKIFITVDIVGIVIGVTLLILGSYIGAVVLIFGVGNTIRDYHNARKTSKVQAGKGDQNEQ